MDISSVSVESAVAMAAGLKNANAMNSVGVKLLDSTLDTASAQGAQLARMMELSVNPGVGGNFDMSV